MKVEFEVTDEIISDLVRETITDHLCYVEDPANAMALIRTYQYFTSRLDWPKLWEQCAIPDFLYDEYEELKSLLGK